MLNNNQGNFLLNNLSLQQKLEDRKVFEQFLNKPDHVTKDNAKGKLVKETPVQQFGAMFTDTFQDMGNLQQALLTGKSNDHSLGRMNDLGMKLGGSLIAAALMGSKATTSKKLMEVLGFTTFFSVMSLWPKLAIDLPTKLKYGFNPHQKYIDSQGRKKQFFLDNQYLPWDVWSKEDINKIADKMGVPKDLKDREEFTKEKMRTIALQDNTLWMLTAGFATPLCTSLACNRLEALAKTPITKLELWKVNKNIKNSGDIINKIVGNSKVFGAQDKAFEGIKAQLKQGILPENLEEELTGIFDLRNAMTDSALKGTLTRSSSVGAGVYSSVFGSIKPTLVFEDSELLKYLTEGETPEKAAEILSKLNEVKANLGPNTGLKDVVRALEEEYGNGGIAVLSGKTEISESWVQKLSQLSQQDPKKAKAFAKQMTKYDKESLAKCADELDKMYTGWLKPSQAQMRMFERNIGLLDGISGEKYNKVAKTLVDSLGLSGKEIDVIKNSNEAAGGTLQEILTGKISEIAKDDAKFESVMKKLDKQIESVDKGASKKGSAMGAISSTFNKLAEKVQSSLRSLAGNVPKETREAIGDVTTKGLTKAEIEGVRTNMTSVNSVLVRLRGALEIEREIQNGSIFEKWSQVSGQAVSPEDKNLLAALFRKLSWQTSYGDIMNKDHITGNSEFFENVVKTVFSGAEQGTDKANWQRIVNELFLQEQFVPNPSLSKEGSAILGKFNGKAWTYFHKYNEKAAESGKTPLTHLGQIPEEILEQFRKEASMEVTGRETSEVFKSSSLKFADLGESALNTLKKRVGSVYNDRKWMKIFGGLTIALVGITLVSQLFFGKVKDANLYKKTTDKDTFESGK